jgi:hypothetical protein
VIVSSVGDEVVRVEIHSNEHTIEILIEAAFETLSEGLSTLGHSQHSTLLGEATTAAARCAAKAQ